MEERVSRPNRLRVAKACTECSRKKIRCDGKNQCASCRGSGAVCVYESHKERKPRTKKGEVSERLARLENLVAHIAHKLDARPSSGPPELHAYESPRSLSEDKKTDVLPPQELPLVPEPARAREGFFSRCKSVLKQLLEDSRSGLAPKPVVHYKGTHLGFSVLGDKATKYLRDRLRPEDHYITVPLQTLPFYVNMWRRAFQTVWSDPQIFTAEEIAQLRKGRFPNDQSLVKEIILYYRHAHLATFVFDLESAQELFDNYYMPHDSAQRRNLSYSELMLMSLVLATSLSLVIDQEALDAYSTADYKLLPQQSSELLVALQEEMFMNAVYYYHRICAMSEGVSSIQALLLMSIYLETLWVISDVNYNLTSLAIRYAQEIGLHVYEASEGLSVFERVSRIKLWTACQSFDVDVCYRLGKPPLLHSEFRLSPPAARDYALLLQGGCTHTIRGIGTCPYAEQCADLLGYLEVFLSLSQLRLDTYYLLFSSLSSKTVRQVQTLVSEINAKSFAFCESIEMLLRPKLYHEKGFDHFLQSLSDGTKTRNMFCMLLSMAYFSHLMTVNRVPWQVVVDESEAPARETPEFRRLSLDSARTILHLVRIIDKRSWPFMTLNWMLVFQFLAAMNLCGNCMNHANEKETFKDLSLLIDISMNYFGYFGNLCLEGDTKLHYMRFQLVDVLLRVLLRVIIKVVEERNTLNILDGNDELRLHLESAEHKFPHIYKEEQSVPPPCPDVPKECDQANSIAQSDFPPIKLDPAVFQPNLLADLLHPEFKPLDPARQVLLEDDMNFMSFWTQEMVNMPNVFFDNGL